jgi:hypothetical protein
MPLVSYRGGCGGPSQEAAYRIADEYTDKVLADLKEKHHVDTPGSWPNLKSDHEEAKAQLRAAIRELIWIEHCVSW